MRYGITSLTKDFPDDESCLTFLLDSKECLCGGRFRILRERCFQCSRCRKQVYPTQGTIFEKSTTPLKLWFQALLVFSNAKSGISASEMQRELETTYKTAWKILSLIRGCLKQEGKLSGEVETDIAFFGGVSRKQRSYENKSTVIAAIERTGRVRAQVVRDGMRDSHDFILKSVETGSRLLSDRAASFKKVGRHYRHHTVNHSKHYVRKDVHINHVESFWSHVKRSMKGTYKSVSKRHLQSYIDSFVFHYNFRHDDRERFKALLDIVKKKTA